MTRSRFEVHIEELVLVGFDPADRARIGASVERELGLLLERAPPVTPGSAERLDGGSFTHAPGASPRRVGTQIAAAVHGAVASSATARQGKGPRP